MNFVIIIFFRPWYFFPKGLKIKRDEKLYLGVLQLGGEVVLARLKERENEIALKRCKATERR